MFEFIRGRIIMLVKQILDSKGRDIWSVNPENSVFEVIKIMAEKGESNLVEQYDYDVFISYRHKTNDIKWAKWLLENLETFRAPKILQQRGIRTRIGKVFRDDNGIITQDRRLALMKELGDVAWYWSQLCLELDLDPAEVLRYNILKLGIRVKRGTIHGEGSDR